VPSHGITPSDGIGPASDAGQVEKAPDDVSAQGDQPTAATEGTISAGEAGRAVEASPTAVPAVQVIIGEIPDEHDISVMRWTARCSNPEHDLLGHFDSEEAALDAKGAHLAAQH
jgi:hypothetical protein